MTNQRPDKLDDAATDPAGMAIDPETIIPPEQPPMDDAAGGPTAEPKDAPVNTRELSQEEIAAELGDFA